MTRTKPPTTRAAAATIPFPKSVETGEDELDRILQTLPVAQRARVLEVVSRNLKHGPGIEMKVKMEGGNLAVNFSHKSPEAAALVLMADLATMDHFFFMGVTGQIARIGTTGAKIDEANSNFLLSVVRAVHPRDEVETLLAVQMGAIHAATMMMAWRLNRADTIPLQEATERALNKLARTYAGQMETLKRYRTGGQQRVVVEHVTVNAGGQAVVGTVATR